MKKKPSATRPGTVQKIVKSPYPGEPEKGAHVEVVVEAELRGTKPEGKS